MFASEVRFYREIAPDLGVRVPACYQAEDSEEGTLLVLEDLSEWQPGADPLVAARVLAGMHARWAGRAAARWPWLRPVGAGVDLVSALYDRTWTGLEVRRDLPPRARTLGARLVGKVVESEYAISGTGPLTVAHGDASLANMRTSPDGEVALLDWEDVSSAPGVLDLAWLLVSSVEPAQWNESVAAYGTSEGLTEVLPAVSVQALLSFSDTAEGSAEALAWSARIDAAADHLDFAD